MSEELRRLVDETLNDIDTPDWPPILRAESAALIALPVYLPGRDIIVTPMPNPTDAGRACVVLHGLPRHDDRSILFVAHDELRRAERVDYLTRRPGDPLVRLRRVRVTGDGTRVQTLTVSELDAPNSLG